jgi:hypothetical protein
MRGHVEIVQQLRWSFRSRIPWDFVRLFVGIPFTVVSDAETMAKGAVKTAGYEIPKFSRKHPK